MSNELMLASGKLSSYKLLVAYLSKVDKKLRSKALPQSIDIEYVRRLVDEGINRVSDLINELSKYLKGRISGEHARKVVREVLGIDVGEDEAISYIAKELASWIIELSENLNVIRIKGRWERR